MNDFHIGDIVQNRTTGGKSVVRSEGLWGARFYDLVSCPHKSTPADECRRLTDDAPAPFAVQQSQRRTCIEWLAEGWTDCVSDLCPSCTRQFMAALDTIDKPLSWHAGYVERAGEVAQ